MVVPRFAPSFGSTSHTRESKPGRIAFSSAMSLASFMHSAWHVQLAALGAALASCGPPQPTVVDQAAATHASLASKSDPSAALGTPQLEPSRPSPWPLVVGGPTGIVGVDENGRIVRRYTSTPTDAVRTAPDGQLWFVSPQAGELELHELSPTGVQRVVAAVPKHFDRQQCAPSASSNAAELYLHETADFVVSPSRVCVVLSDRNVNMRSLSVATTIDPVSGAHASAVYAPECGREESPACNEREASVPRASSTTVHPYRYDEASGAVLHTANDAHAFTMNGEQEQPARVLATSRSGELLLIGIFQGQGDYFHWTPVALDLRTGFAALFEHENDSVIAVPYGPGPSDETQSESLDIVTETEVYFVDDRRAVIDALLISFPKEPLTHQKLPRAIALPGRPAPRP